MALLSSQRRYTPAKNPRQEKINASHVFWRDYPLKIHANGAFWHAGMIIPVKTVPMARLFLENPCPHVLLLFIGATVREKSAPTPASVKKNRRQPFLRLRDDQSSETLRFRCYCSPPDLYRYSYMLYYHYRYIINDASLRSKRKKKKIKAVSTL